MKNLILIILLCPLLAFAQPTPVGGPPPATQTEVNAGVVANKYVSPLTLNNWSGGGGGGTPGGSDTQVQYNNAGSFGGATAGYNNSTGVITFPSSFIFTPATITITANAGTIDITKGYSQATNNANTTLTPSAAGTDGQFIQVDFINSGGTDRTITVDTASDFTFTAYASQTTSVTMRSNGSGWVLFNIVPVLGTGSFVKSSIATGTIGFSVDGTGTVVAPGTVGYIVVPFTCTITGWNIAAKQSGSVALDIYKIAAGTTLPTSSITGSAPPALSAAAIATSTTLTGWTTTVSAGDIIGWAITGTPTTTTQFTFQLTYNRN